MSPNHSPNPSPDNEVAALRAVVESLSAQVAQLQRRLDVLEHFNAAPQASPPPATTAAIVPPPPAPVSAPLESRFGLTVVNRIGALTLAIGIIFFFKYAVDNQWIGAAGRVFLGILAGVALLAAGEWLNRKDQRVFSQGIAGCGLAALYVSLYAAFVYYKLIGQGAGFASLVAVSAIAVALSLRYANAAIAGLGFAGALLTAMLLHYDSPEAWIDFPYLLLLDLTAIVVSVRQRWSVLIPGVAALTVIAGLLLLNHRHGGWFAVFLLCLAALHFVAALYARQPARLHQMLYIAGHGCTVLALLRMTQLWANANALPANRDSIASELDSLLIGIYGVAGLVFGIVRKSSVDRAVGLVLLGIVIAKLYLWDVWLLARFYRVTAFLALGVLLLVASYIYSRWKSRPTTGV